MNAKKKFFACLLSFFVLFSLGACSKAEEKAPAEKVSDPKEIADLSEKNNKQKKEGEPESGEKAKDRGEIAQESAELIEINEKIFLQKINDIYFNYQDYKDARIAVEGMFSRFQNFDATETRPVVYRYGPGCCGNDGWGGFFLKYDGDFPEENDWIRVIGRPIIVKSEKGWVEVFLKVESLEVKEERGAEYVAH